MDKTAAGNPQPLLAWISRKNLEIRIACPKDEEGLSIPTPPPSDVGWGSVASPVKSGRHYFRPPRSGPGPKGYASRLVSPRKWGLTQNQDRAPINAKA